MRISTPEFIALMAMLVATVALSIDAMLPALPNIALELTPNHTNQAQLILSSFILGMALGTFVMGPLSDSFGRKNIIYFGASVYIISSALCMFAPNLETIVVARVLQGIGAAAPRGSFPSVDTRPLFGSRNGAYIILYNDHIFISACGCPFIRSRFNFSVRLASNFCNLYFICCDEYDLDRNSDYRTFKARNESSF